MFIGVDKDNNAVDIAELKDNHQFKLFCPACGCELIAKRGNIKVHHFAHKDPKDCGLGAHKEMTEGHRNWQRMFDKKYREKVVRFGEKIHRADVVYKNYVIEFQHSDISESEFSDRNKFYNSAGYKVIWIFDKLSNEIGYPITQKGNLVYDKSYQSKVISENLGLDGQEMYDGDWTEIPIFKGGTPSKDVCVILQLANKDTSFNHEEDTTTYSINYLQTIIKPFYERKRKGKKVYRFTTTSTLGNIERLLDYIDRQDHPCLMTDVECDSKSNESLIVNKFEENREGLIWIDEC